MQARTSPLSVIINPPGIQYGMPGDSVSLYAVVINEGDQSAVIDLFFTFDETFQNISGWSASPRASLAVAPKESSDEVTFDFEIPVDALAGTYDYTFVVDSPEHYPQDTPLNFPGQLKVLLKEQTVIRAFDPTFSIIPATNPNKTITSSFDQPLQVVVKVENRSNRVDRFRLTCPDLDDEWFKITYPATGLEGAGLFDVSALELNPNSEGEIYLEFRPPIDTLAGSYSPTIRLLSENNPDLILLDLIYLNIQANYCVNIELHTILGKVSYKNAVYELVLNNQGNLIRELFFNAKTRDEKETCTYKFAPTELKLLPNTTEKTSLLVKPSPWWCQPLFGQPLLVNFEVNIKDKQSYPLANASPQANLSWKARPWWQFLLLILLGLGLFAGAGYIIWRMLNPEPLKIESFNADNPTITEGDDVNLNWKIDNYKQIENLEVTVNQQPDNYPLLSYKKNDLKQLITQDKNNRNPFCQVTNQEELICNLVPTGIRAKGKYIFELKASSLRGISLFKRTIQTDTQTTDVEITQKPIAEIVNFKADKPQYTKGENILWTWTIRHPELLEKVVMNNKTDDNIQVDQPVVLKFKDGKPVDTEDKTLCKDKGNQTLACTISIIASTTGLFNYELTAFSRHVNDRTNTKKADNKILIVSKKFNIVYFKINNSEQQNQVLKEGTKANLSWKVEGEKEDIQVRILPYGNDVDLIGSLLLPVIKDFPTLITLQVIDKSGKQLAQQRGLAITVNPIPKPTPKLVTPAPLPRQHIFKPFPAFPGRKPRF